MQDSSKVGIQGVKASYHEIAAHKLHKNAKLIYYETFSDLFKGLRKKEISSAVVAIANNRVQFISDTYEELTKNSGEFEITGEIYLRVEHALLAPKGASLASIKEVHSQPPAINQCRDFLENNLSEALIIEEHDTATSARMVAEWGDTSKAAIASEKAGEIYNLQVVKKSIQDDPDNITRFFEIRLNKTGEPIKLANKTSMMLKTKELPGALFDALRPFKEHGINLNNLHSRIIPNTAFEMLFFIEFDAGLQEPRTKKVLQELSKVDDEYTVLGSYIRADIPINEV